MPRESTIFSVGSVDSDYRQAVERVRDGYSSVVVKATSERNASELLAKIHNTSGLVGTIDGKTVTIHPMDTKKAEPNVIEVAPNVQMRVIRIPTKTKASA